jgi:RHS repeat-associated protein
MYRKKRSIVQIVALGLIIVSTFFSLAGISLAVESQQKRGINPTGSFALSEIETINTTSGNLMLRFPLGTLPAGRGGLAGQINLFYNSKLYDSRTKFQGWAPGGQPQLFERSMLNTSDEGGWRYGVKYVLKIINRKDQYPFGSEPQYPDPAGIYRWKLSMAFPDGSVHEFVPRGYNANQDVLKDGFYDLRPDGWQTQWNEGHIPQDFPYISNTITYYSADASYLRLDVQHDADADQTNNAWTLYLGDGTRVTGAGTAGLGTQRVTDRNGNYIEIADITYNGHQSVQLIDQLGRDVILEKGYAANTDAIHVKGAGGTELTTQIKWKTLQVYKTYITSYDGNGSGYPDTIGLLTVVSEITLPSQTGGLKYTFGYNASDHGAGSPPYPTPSYGWGELSSITLPSGATVQYAYSLDGINGPTNGPDHIDWETVLEQVPVSKTLTYNQDYDGASTPVTETWSYGIISRPPGVDGSSTITSPDAGVTVDYFDIHHRVYKTVRPDGSVVERLWQENVPEGHPQVLTSYVSDINSYVKTEFTSIRDAANSLSNTAIRDYTYDKNGNVTVIKDYDWVGYNSVPRDAQGRPTGVLPFTPKRITTTAYHASTPDASDTTTASTNGYYDPSSPQFRGAVASTEIGDASQILARSEYFYDGSTTTANLIEQKSWDSTKGAYSSPLTTSNSISVTHQYDGYGNPTLTTDARGFSTQFVYGTVGSVTDLYPTEIRAANQTSIQRTETRLYDFYSGLPTQITDLDNEVATVTTYDVFGRPKLVQSAVGTDKETKVQTEYDDILRRVIVKSDLNQTGDGKLVTIQHYDQLGRVRLVQQLEDATNESPTVETSGIKVQTRYGFINPCTPQNDPTCIANNAAILGSYQIVSNPYRATTSGGASAETTMGWTRSRADRAGRPLEVATFGGATLPPTTGINANWSGSVSTAYDATTAGSFTTVTDQAGRVRRSMTNALGQLVRVDEPSDQNNTLGVLDSPTQPTNYSYDALGNLLTVTQGSQTRTFAYTSLSRLKDATNPENGTVSYEYDNSGNLKKKIDPRLLPASQTHVTITYGDYDALNRVTSRSYNDGTPNVTYTYDSASVPFSKGRLTEVSSSVSSSSYGEYDALGRIKASTQTTDGRAALTQYSYNLAGALTSETYPSGRVVEYGYDGAGRIAGVNRSGGSYYAGGAPTDTSNRIQYSAAGAALVTKLGNGLWEHTNYNSRLQITQIGLGTSSSDSSKLRLDYTYGVLVGGVLDPAKNNGNVQSQTITVPSISAIAQAYTYDELNRLKVAQEAGSGGWTENFTYDRFGNRTGLSVTQNVSYPLATIAPEVDAATNRFKKFNGQSQPTGYDYDAAGNLTQEPGPSSTFTLYVYDAENRLIQAKSLSGQTETVISSYVYDGDGRRVKRIVADTASIYAYNASGQMLAEYTSGPVNPSATTGYLTEDHLGTPRAISNSTGQVTERHDYLPFGEEIPTAYNSRSTVTEYVADNLRQKFTGKERDDETGLDYFSARYHQSAAGRFTSVDPYDIVHDVQTIAQSSPGKAAAQLVNYLKVPQQWNRFPYVLNNPLKYVDPTGELLELTGDIEEAFAQVKLLVGEKGAKLLFLRTENGHTYVDYKGSRGEKRQEVDALIAAQPEGVNAFLAKIINTKDRVIEVQVADSFSTKYLKNINTAGGLCGGACTVGAEESLTGNTQIFLNKNSGSISEVEFNKPPNAVKFYPGGHIWSEDDVVFAHELGHAYANAIEGKPLRNSDASYDRSVEFENAQRATYPTRRPLRRLVE